MRTFCERAEQKDESYRALNLILEAWDDGAEQGIAPELMAYAALFTALTDLVATFGEEAVAGLAGGLVNRVRRGDFTVPGTMQ
jgi:hypothetical protein